MDAGHQFRCRFLLALQKRDPVNIAFAPDRKIAEPAIGADSAARFDGLRQKCQEAVGGRIRYPLHADSADSGTVLLSRDGNQGLTFRFPPSDALLQAAQVGFATSTVPANRSLPGRTIARLNLCNQVQAVL